MSSHDKVLDGPVVERTPIDGKCAACGVANLRSYAVLSEGGWFQAVKCQTCLSSAERERWKLLGPITLTSEGIAIA